MGPASAFLAAPKCGRNRISMLARNSDAPEVIELSPVERINYFVSEPSKVRIKRALHAHELTLVFDRLEALAGARTILISTMRNEAFRIPFFLDYYRRMGVEHFIFIDNESTDTLHDIVRNAPDVSLYMAHGSFKAARYGMAWVNHLLHKHAVGKWILHVDPDEFLVYPNCDTEGLALLTEQLERKGLGGLPTLMVDMYSDRPIGENVCRPDQNPAEICPYFDATSYVETVHVPLTVKEVRGGPRARTFFAGPSAGPMLHKTPLVKWGASHMYVRCAHEVWPPNLADRSYQTRKGMAGALLHFKFLAEFTEKVDEEAERGQHTDEYKQYLRTMQDNARMSFMTPNSVRFEGWRSLADCGLIS